MKIIFAGTPEFAAYALAALLKSHHEIIAVYTQPDRPAGRGLKLTPSKVKELALQHNLPVYQPATLKDVNAQQELKNLNADVMVVAAYGLLLPQAVLDAPRLGCINIHPSLLPRWRGAAPIQRTIFAGDKMTGVTIMQMDAGLDTGPMFLQQEYALAADETSQTLHDKLAVVGAETLLETLALVEKGHAKPIVQDNALATYADKIKKEEALIDWQQGAHEIDCKIRAFNPFPMAYTMWNDERLRIGLSAASKESHKQKPGTIISVSSEGIDVATGNGIVRLLQLQLPGGKMLSIKDFYNAKRDELTPGKQFT